MVVIVAVAAELAFRAQDVRLPSDPGRTYAALPDLYWSIRAGGSPSFDGLWREPGTWLVALQAETLAAIGRSARVFGAPALAAHVLSLVAVAASARRLAGAWGAVAATALFAAMPRLFLEARADGVTVIEGALVAGAFALLVVDRGMKRIATPLAVATMGALAITLRDEAHWYVWPLVPLLFARQRRWGRIALVLAIWLFASAPAAFRIADAVLRAWVVGLDARLDVGNVLTRLRWALGGPVVLAGVPGLLLAGRAAWLRARAGARPRLDAGAAVLLLWCVSATVAHVFFRLSPDDSLLFAVALAIGAGWGLGTWGGRGAAIAGAVLAVVVGTQQVPRTHLAGLVPLVPDQATIEGQAVRYRPETRWGARDVAALLDATCPDETWHGCRVVVEQGLFAPDSTEFGLLELFLLADERIELRTVHEMEAGRWRDYKVHALAVFDCGPRDDHWRMGAPDSTKLALELIRSQSLDVAFARQVDSSCVLAWLTPGGEVARPDALPRNPNRAQWDAATLDAHYEDWVARNPKAAQRRGRTFVYPGRTRPTVPPDAFSMETAAAEREAARAALPEDERPSARPQGKGGAGGKKPPPKKKGEAPPGAGNPRAPAAPR